MFTLKTIKTIGTLATVAGAGISLLSGWVSEKKQEEAIKKEVKKEVNSVLNSMNYSMSVEDEPDESGTYHVDVKIEEDLG